jgi:hypothetical protein
LNWFITQWRETKDPDLKHSAHMSQVAENVIRSMQYKKGEALANHNSKMLEWCSRHTEALREIERTKFDEVTAFILEYLDVHTKLTAEEIKANEANKRSNTRGGDNNRKQFLELIEQTDDLVFAIWANV